MLPLLSLAAQAELSPFEFAQFSTVAPVGSSWVEENKSGLCLNSDTTNAAHCMALSLRFTGRPVLASLTLVDRKLSKLSIRSEFLDFETVRASLTEKYGSPCRNNVWCFATGELHVVLAPFDFSTPRGRPVIISYDDRVNLEVRKPAVPKVDF